MDAEFHSLEEKIKQFIEKNKQLREENQRMRLRLAHLEGENRRHSERMNLAKTKLENLLARIPNDEK